MSSLMSSSWDVFFHWAQAVWHKIQAVGLQGAYTNDTNTHSYLRKLLSVPYLPHEHINQAFYQLAAQAVTPALQKICNYISGTWISNPLWPTSSWSAFMRNTCTNNDVVGWHCRLNAHAKKSNLPFYVLIQLLHKEALTTGIEVQLISDKKLKVHSEEKLSTTARSTVPAVGAICSWYEDCKQINRSPFQDPHILQKE